MTSWPSSISSSGSWRSNKAICRGSRLETCLGDGCNGLGVEWKWSVAYIPSSWMILNYFQRTFSQTRSLNVILAPFLKNISPIDPLSKFHAQPTTFKRSSLSGYQNSSYRSSSIHPPIHSRHFLHTSSNSLFISINTRTALLFPPLEGESSDLDDTPKERKRERKGGEKRRRSKLRRNDGTMKERWRIEDGCNRHRIGFFPGDKCSPCSRSAPSLTRERERERELPWIFYSVCLDHIRHAERSLHYGVGCFLGFETMPVHDV